MSPAQRADPPRIALGLAAAGRPAYINLGHDVDHARGLGVDDLRERAHHLLDSAWKQGVRDFDVARSYGLAEQFLGEWIADHPERRPQMMISSKWGYRYVGQWQVDAPVHERKDHSLAAFTEQWPLTVEALGSVPDQYLIHSVTPDSPALTDTALLDALRAVRDREQIRVGLSTSGPHQAAVVRQALALEGSPFSVVQSTWNLLEPSVGSALAEASAAGWRVMVKEAVANGRLTDRGDVAALISSATDAGLSSDAVALAAVLAQPWADLVLSGASTPAQLRSNRLAATVPGDLVDRITVTPEPAVEYWSARSELPWI